MSCSIWKLIYIFSVVGNAFWSHSLVVFSSSLPQRFDVVPARLMISFTSFFTDWLRLATIDPFATMRINVSFCIYILLLQPILSFTFFVCSSSLSHGLFRFSLFRFDSLNYSHFLFYVISSYYKYKLVSFCSFFFVLLSFSARSQYFMAFPFYSLLRIIIVRLQESPLLCASRTHTHTHRRKWFLSMLLFCYVADFHHSIRQCVCVFVSFSIFNGRVMLGHMLYVQCSSGITFGWSFSLIHFSVSHIHRYSFQ